MSHDIQPLRLVFRWMMRGFSGHLPPDQVRKISKPIHLLWENVFMAKEMNHIISKFKSLGSVNQAT